MPQSADRFRLSSRLAALRQRRMDSPTQPLLTSWRDYHFLREWVNAEGASLPERFGRSLAAVIREIPLGLSGEASLAGEHGGDHSNVGFRSHLGGDVVERALAAGLPAEAVDEMRGWVASQPFAWQSLAAVAGWPPELREAQDRAIVQVWGTDLNHSIRDYSRVLSEGFTGIISRIDAGLAAQAPTDPQAPQRRATLWAFRAVADAALGLGVRHAAALRAQAADARDEATRTRLQTMADTCERVPAQPAHTFAEAVQSLWFAHMVTVWEDGVNANGIGRIDQILWPYLEADLAAGRTTRAEASDLLAELWLKLYMPYDVQQMMVGGRRTDGSDAVNPLSYLVLDVTEAMDFVRCLSARLHNGSPRPFVTRCVELVARGGGIPFFFNDEALVPALVDHGVPIEDAQGYAAIGCIEITVPGKASPHAVSHWINLARVLELTLHGGRDPRDGRQVGPVGPDLRQCSCMDGLVAAFRRQLEHFAAWSVYGSNSAETAHQAQYRLPYLSILTDDCIGRGMDIIEGGARYNYHSSAAMGVPNAADSLAALNQVLYVDGSATADEILAALGADFEGHEALRGRMMRCARYGNDDAEPDAMAARLVDMYCDVLDGHQTVRGGRFFTHLFTFTLMLPMGRATGATPDGRRAGEPLAYSVSPGQGRDTHGLTAVVRSLAALPHHRVAASSSAILELDPALLESGGIDAFVDLLMAAVRMRVGQLQFNVVSAETLRAAQEDPGRYANLCVRVSGFSQQFRLLDREMQEHIIARTKHAQG
ncbi:MAG: hypothetical protein NT029_15060 [Armatimonadetes bacterium]|nr:hypothetical protein [Armatimonadota bacterium]